MNQRIVLPDADKLVDEYLAGASINKLANKRGVSRQVVTSTLVELGVELRSQSEAELLKWSRMNARQRASQTSAAQVARRGTKDTPEALHKRALARCKRVGRFEYELAEMLRARGLRVVEQLPVGAYNLDIASEELRLAVEVLGTVGDRVYFARLRERTKYLLDAGWCLVFVPLRTAPQKRDPGLPAIAENLIALSKRLRRDDSSRGKYGVIGRHGKPTAYCSRELHDLPRIPGL